MRLQFFGYFLSMLFAVSCTDHEPKKTEQSYSENKTKIQFPKKPAGNFSDTLKINSTAAVFYAPDSLQLEKIKSITDPKVFKGSMHEYYYLSRNAHLVIKRDFPKLQIIEAKNVRYLLFIIPGKTNECIDLDTKNDSYGLFLFRKGKSPVVADMANIESSLGFYFSD